MTTKSGLMLGLGEEPDEVRTVMHDLRGVGCDILTLGQYLQPLAGHLPVARFVPPEEFSEIEGRGAADGLPSCRKRAPWCRSSYHARRADLTLNPRCCTFVSLPCVSIPQSIQRNHRGKDDPFLQDRRQPQKWHLVDADGKTLGRVATQVARLLRGKHKVEFTRTPDLWAISSWW